MIYNNLLFHVESEKPKSPEADVAKVSFNFIMSHGS